MIGRTFVTLTALLSCSAFAQDEADADESPAEAQPSKRPSAQAKPPQIKLDPAEDKAELLDLARHFFAAVTLGETRSLADMSAVPFQLDDQTLSTEVAFIEAWQTALREKNTSLLTLYGIEVLTAAEMEKKYGKPPARLAKFPWKKPNTYVVVANLSGRAAVAVFQKSYDTFFAIAYHD